MVSKSIPWEKANKAHQPYFKMDPSSPRLGQGKEGKTQLWWLFPVQCQVNWIGCFWICAGECQKGEQEQVVCQEVSGSLKAPDKPQRSRGQTPNSGMNVYALQYIAMVIHVCTLCHQNVCIAAILPGRHATFWQLTTLTLAWSISASPWTLRRSWKKILTPSCVWRRSPSIQVSHGEH